MSRGEFLGDFEQLILLAVWRLGREAYGLGIQQELAARAGREASIGAIYTTLDRLEQKELVRSELGESTAERGGRAKRIFTVTPGGKAALRQSIGATRAMADGLKGLGLA
ncbi:MAG: helix-turn-helix transcriptional regulator [Bryobacterales bacterium]|nr:helix-turn-helix transcriptional regulator [Bryobacterales bacterium]